MTAGAKTQDYVNQLWDQFEAIDDLLAHAHSPKDLSDHRFMLNSALMSLTQIGEIVSRLTRPTVGDRNNKHYDRDFAAMHGNWEPVIGLRNIAVHEYTNVDVNIIWQALTLDAKNLRDTIVAKGFVRREPDRYKNLPLSQTISLQPRRPDDGTGCKTSRDSE